MQRILKTIVLVALPVTGFAVAAQPAIDLSLIYDSKYVSEGRDNLGEGGLYSGEAVASFENGFAGGIWYAKSTDSSVDYRETNYFVEYGFMLGSLESYVGYTHLDFNDDSHDNEWGAGVATTELPVTLAADYRYSVESEGGFLELIVGKDFETASGFVVTPYLMQGVDFGYASPTHDGANNTQVGIGVEKSLTMNVTVSAHVNHSIAGEDVDRDGLGDETFGGAAITLSF